MADCLFTLSYKVHLDSVRCIFFTFVFCIGFVNVSFVVQCKIFISFRYFLFLNNPPPIHLPQFTGRGGSKHFFKLTIFPVRPGTDGFSLLCCVGESKKAHQGGVGGRCINWQFISNVSAHLKRGERQGNGSNLRLQRRKKTFKRK